MTDIERVEIRRVANALEHQALNLIRERVPQAGDIQEEIGELLYCLCDQASRLREMAEPRGQGDDS